MCSPLWALRRHSKISASVPTSWERERERERERESYRLVFGPVIPTPIRDAGWMGGCLGRTILHHAQSPRTVTHALGEWSAWRATALVCNGMPTSRACYIEALNRLVPLLPPSPHSPMWCLPQSIHHKSARASRLESRYNCPILMFKFL